MEYRSLRAIKVTLTLFFVFTVYVSAAHANTDQSSSYPAHSEYVALKRLMANTAEELSTAKGLHKFVLGSRFVNASLEQREKLAALYEQFNNAENPDPALKATLIEIVQEQSTSLKAIIEHIDTLNAQDEADASKLESQTDILILEQVVSRRNKILDQYLRALFVNTQYQEGLGLQPQADSAYLKNKLDVYASYAADRVEALLDARENFKSILVFASDNVKTEINEKLRALEHKKAGSIDALAQRLNLMNDLGMATEELAQFLVVARGQLSGDVLDAGILVGLTQKMSSAMLRWLSENGIDLVLSALLFVAIIFVFVFLAGLVKRIVKNALDHSNLRISELLRKFFVSMSSKIVLLIGFLIALSQLGVEVGPMLAGLGMVGFIIGFALQDTLSNFASGMMILIYRPFDEGNLIETAGVTGTVSKLSLVSTTILTFDNQSLVIPNSKIWGDVIRNVTAQTTRRVDMVFGIGYSDDIPKAEAVLADILSCHPKVLKNPEPMIKLHTLNESSVDFIVRPWAATSDYWEVYWDVTRTVKQRFDEEGISIPFPQRDLHVYHTGIEQNPDNTL